MSDPPPGESLGARYGDPRLDQRARHLTGGGAVMEVFRVREEGDTLNIRCQVSPGQGWSAPQMMMSVLTGL